MNKMNLSNDLKEKHLRWLIAGSFFVSVIAAIISWFFPPDISVDPPKINEFSLLLGQLQEALVILGCTALAIKLTEEGQTMSSIGFTMMAVTQGVIFVLYVVSPEPLKENLDEVFKLFTASLFLLIPTMLLISYYSDFPKWLKLLGLLAIVPWIVENILYYVSHSMNPITGIVDFIGQLLLNITVFSWGFYVLKGSGKNFS